MQGDDIQCVFQSMTGTGSIYISNFSAAQNLELLHSKAIKAILSVARSGLIHHKKEDIPHYLYIPAEDREDYPIYKHFDLTYDFIERARRQTNVLIHCMAGVSRSVTIVIAYLLKKYKYTLGKVITMIQRRRRKLNPNKGFIEQLKKFSEKEGIKCDFEELSVPNNPQSSNLKPVRSYSARKQRSYSKKPEPLSPITPPEKQSKKQWNCETNIFYNEDLTNPVIKFRHLELKRLNSYEKQGEQNEQQASIKKEVSKGKQKLDLRKSFSLNEDNRERKRLSIEEKISKIREKMVKSDQSTRKQASISTYYTQKGNKKERKVIQLQNQVKKPASSSISKAEPSENRLKIEHKYSQNTKQKDSQLIDFSSDEAKGTIFTAEFKIEHRPLYHINSRVNPRMNAKIKQDANY